MLQSRFLVWFKSLERLESHAILRRGVCAGCDDTCTTKVADEGGGAPCGLAARLSCRLHGADVPKVCARMAGSLTTWSDARRQPLARVAQMASFWLISRRRMGCAASGWVLRLGMQLVATCFVLVRATSRANGSRDLDLSQHAYSTCWERSTLASLPSHTGSATQPQSVCEGHAIFYGRSEPGRVVVGGIWG